MDKDLELQQLLVKYGVSQSGESTPAFASRSADPDSTKSLRPSSTLESRRRPSPIRYPESRTSDSEFKLRLQSSDSSVRPASKSPKSGQETSRSFPESKAFTMAMTALQEKVKVLEGDNARLSRDNLRLQAAAKDAAARNELTDRVKTTEDANSKLQEQLHEKDIALKRLTAEFSRALGELRKAKDLIERLQVHAQAKEKLSHKTEKSRFLETRNKYLEELTAKQTDTIARLTQEMEQQQRMGENREQKRSAKSQDQRSLQNSLRSPLMFVSPVRGEGTERMQDSVSNYLTTDGDNQMALSPTNSLDTSTQRLEREIEDYNKQYKALLKKSQEPGADLLSLRVELNSIAAAMEAKSNHLAAVRRQLSRDYGAKI